MMFERLLAIGLVKCYKLVTSINCAVCCCTQCFGVRLDVSCLYHLLCCCCNLCHLLCCSCNLYPLCYCNPCHLYCYNPCHLYCYNFYHFYCCKDYSFHRGVRCCHSSFYLSFNFDLGRYTGLNSKFGLKLRQILRHSSCLN